jgi:membrane fusion protein
VLIREEAVLTRRQQLAELDRVRASKLAALAETRRAMERVRAEAGAQSAGLASSRAEIEQRQVNAQAEQGYVLIAPVNGVVTAVTARRGQAVDGGQSLMAVVPSNSSPRAELHVPTSAAGFLAIGQEVRLAIDAFPYQRFGTVPARITQISATTVLHDDASGAAVPVYLVTAELRRPWVMAFGRRQPLLTGMTLSARIVTERQSLLQWLFQPVFAVRNR